MNQFLEDMAQGPRIIIITGHFGSGKTEVSVSLAYALAAMRGEGHPNVKNIALCDLDVENPYFRSRELTETMGEAGIRVYSDPYHGQNGSELQTLDPAILAPVQDPDCHVIMDTGGNNTGAMILNQFRKHFGADYRMLYIANKNRPGTDTPEKVLAEIEAIQYSTGLVMSGIISNSHFIRETTAEDVLEGAAFANHISEISGLPLLCSTCSENLVDEVRKADPTLEIFPVGMYMRQTYLDKKV